MIGFFNVIKPTGVSSGYVVNRIKHLGINKVGHLGTLDPLASGVLPIAVGKAVRLFDYFLKKNKVYFALMKMNVLTDTLDSEGKVLLRENKPFSLEDIRAEAKKLEGEIMQVPPIYSAVHIDGKRAYMVAQENPEYNLPAKKTQIYSIKVEKWHQNDVFALTIHCSAGTYVRSIVRDIANGFGLNAVTTAIIRMQSGAFKIEDAVTLDEIEKDPKKHLIRVNDILKLEEVDLTKNQAKDLADGKGVEMDLPDGEYLCKTDDQEFSIAKVNGNLLKNKIYLFEGEL